MNFLDLNIKVNCKNCKHRTHSGAFTEGGAKPVCGHSYARKTFTTKLTEERYHWKHRVLDLKSDQVPRQCPLVNGCDY